LSHLGYQHPPSLERAGSNRTSKRDRNGRGVVKHGPAIVRPKAEPKPELKTPSLDLRAVERELYRD